MKSVKLLSLLEILKKMLVFSHCMTTGFSPFDLLTCDVLLRGQDQSHLIDLRSPAALSWHSHVQYSPLNIQ